LVFGFGGCLSGCLLLLLLLLQQTGGLGHCRLVPLPLELLFQAFGFYFGGHQLTPVLHLHTTLKTLKSLNC
jgi:hypothetical protein